MEKEIKIIKQRLLSLEDYYNLKKLTVIESIESQSLFNAKNNLGDMNEVLTEIKTLKSIISLLEREGK